MVVVSRYNRNDRIRLSVSLGEHRCKPGNAAQKKPSVSQHVEEHRMLARRARHRDA